MDYKNDIASWVDNAEDKYSEWASTIFDYGETSWREYRSCEYYVNLLKDYGFTVEEGSGGMPTAFCATWENGDGPTIGGYAEYDAIPGNCQAPDVERKPRGDLSYQAGGHTDPHSALGVSSLVGILAAQAMMKQNNIQGKLKFFGEPAEKVRGSKPIHAAKGYYDDLDAAISFHPFYMLPYCNTTRWDTHCGACYAMIYTFECLDSEMWLHSSEDELSPIPASHASTRAPAANDALIHMYTLSKSLRESMVSNGTGWSMNECILTAGQATADNQPATRSQIQYMCRTPDFEIADNILKVLDKNAESVALATGCTWRRDWVAKSRYGLANHAMAQLTYDNLKHYGAPEFHTPKAIEKAQTIQKNLGYEPMERPFLETTEKLIDPKEAEVKLREMIPSWQKNFTSDDYTEYCWHAPTVRLYVARPTLAPLPDGKPYPAWVMNALGGIPETINPMINTAGKTIAGTIIDLLTQPDVLNAAQEEFKQRIAEEHVPPLCDYEPPIDFPWPEYITTSRGFEWVTPTSKFDK